MSLSGSSDSRCSSCGDDQVRDLVVDRRAEEDDPLVEQARVDVERALAARGLLDHHRDQRAHRWLLAAGGPQLRLSRLRPFLLGRPELLAGARELDAGSRFDLGGDAVERLAQAQVARGAPRARPASNTCSTASSASSSAARPARGSARSISSSVDLDAELVGDGLEHELARDRRARPRRAAARSSCSAVWPESCEVGLRRDAAALERADEAGQQLARCAPRRAGRRARRSRPRRARRRRPRGTGVSTSSSSCSRMRSSMSARSSSSVSNSLAARASSSSSGGSTFSLISLTRRRRPSPSSRRRARTRPPSSRPRVMPASARLDLVDAGGPRRARRRSRAAPPPSSSSEVDDERRRPSRAGRSSTGASSATETRSASSSCVDQLLGHLGLGVGTSSFVQSAGSTFGCTATVAVKLNRPPRTCRQVVLVLGRRDRTDARARRPRSGTSRRCGSRPPRSRAAPCRSASTSTCIGTLPLRKPGIFTDSARSEVACSTACLTSSSGPRPSAGPCSRAAPRPASPYRGPFKQRDRGPPPASVRSRPARRLRSRGARAGSSGRRRGRRPCSSAGSTRCRSARACRRRGT